MKKLIMSLACALMCTIPVCVSANTVITAPIDGRPISDEYLENLAEIGNDSYLSVSKENLDFFSSYEPDNRLGDSEKVRDEIYSMVGENNNQYSTVIINTSSYITNGLVGSRCGVNYENYKAGLEDLEKLVTDYSEPTYYVNLTMPRSLPETRFNKIWPNEDNQNGIAYYYLKYNENSENYDEISKYSKVTPTQYIMEFSYVVNKANEIGENKLTPWERDFLNYFNKNIKIAAPYKQYVDYYIKPYITTANIFKKLVEMEKNGEIEQIVVSNDDLQIPNSISYFNGIGEDWIQCKNGSPIKYSYARTYMETGATSIHRIITDNYSSQELGRAEGGKGKTINIIYGTDEVPQLIYARDYVARKGKVAQTNFIYNDVSQNIATFDVKQAGNIARAAYAFVRGQVGNYTNSPASIYIYDYKQSENKSASAIDKLKRELKNGSNIGLIELFNGTKENTVFQDLLYNKRGLGLSDLDMYSAWNTNGNAIGLGVAHMQVAAVAKELTKRPKEYLTAQTKMLTQHIIEDGMYTKSGKLTLSNKGYKPNVQDRTNSQTLFALLDTEKAITEMSKKTFEFEENVYKVESMTINRLSFPWGRTFDILVEPEIQVSKVK